MQTENLRYDYDDKFDVLYVALGDRKNSYGDDSQDGVIYLKDIDTDKLTGITILDFCKKKYRTYSKSEIYKIDVVGGMKDEINCFADFDISYIKEFSIKAYYYPFVYAPVLTGDKVGELKIYSNNKLIGTVDIIAPESVTVWQTTN